MITKLLSKSRIINVYKLLSSMGHRALFVACVEGMMVFASLMLSLMLLSDFERPKPDILWILLPVLLPVRLSLLARFNLMRGWWRYTGVNEVVDIIKAVSIGSAIFFGITRIIVGFRAFPQAAYVIEPILVVMFLLAGRITSRLLADWTFHSREVGKMVVIVGAGSGAQAVIAEINKPGSGYTAVACLDDDATKKGISISGVKVEGTVESLPQFLKRHSADEVWIAVPSATSSQMSRFASICQSADITYKTLPSLREMFSDRDVIRQIRPLNLDDLLGRDPVRLDLEIVSEQIEGRVVLVTGAAGSIGSELCRQLLEYDPAVLICLDQNENETFFLQLRNSSHRNAERVVYCVADITNTSRLGSILREHGVELIFHAAAYKHVPLMEANIQEILHNNVFSLLNMLSVAESAGCESLVMISSDKAVNPSSVMGTTKRIGELIISSRPRGNMRCVSVRFGNVLGSNGSVVPILQEQIASRSEVTVTHPEVRRFFMTTTEAVSLVLRGFTLGEHGDLLVLDMGKPIYIMDLAKRLILLSGKTEQEVSIKITGLREGEKLEEEMFYGSEEVWPTVCDKIKRTRSRLHGWQELNLMLESLRDAIATESTTSIKARMKEIVPEYHYDDVIATNDTTGSGHAKRYAPKNGSYSEYSVRVASTGAGD